MSLEAIWLDSQAGAGCDIGLLPVVGIACASFCVSDAHLHLACRSDGAVMAYAYPHVWNHELRMMSTLREHAREVARVHLCLDARMLACRSRRSCQTHVPCGRNARVVRPN